MKVYYYLTNTNHIGNVFEKEEDKIKYEQSYPGHNFNFKEKNLDEERYNYVMKYSTFLIEENENYILDENKYNGHNQKAEKGQRILELKFFLDSGDYKVIKCYEAQLSNEEMPYNLQELLAQRKAWRDEINALEFEISMLG